MTVNFLKRPDFTSNGERPYRSKFHRTLFPSENTKKLANKARGAK